jgi:hypothetical protein
MPETVNTCVKSLSGMVGQPKTSDVKQQTDWNADYRSEQVTSTAFPCNRGKTVGSTADQAGRILALT